MSYKYHHPQVEDAGVFPDEWWAAGYPVHRPKSANQSSLAVGFGWLKLYMLYPDQSTSITLLNRYQCLKIWRMLYHFLGMALDSICNNCHSSVITVTQPCIESRCLLYPISNNIIEGDLVGYLNTHCTSPAWPIADWRVTSTNLWQIWQLSGSGRSLFGSCQDVIQLALHFRLTHPGTKTLPQSLRALKHICCEKGPWLMAACYFKHFDN